MYPIEWNGREIRGGSVSTYTEICRYVIREWSLLKYKELNFHSILYTITMQER